MFTAFGAAGLGGGGPAKDIKVDVGFAGSITAALFLRRFTEKAKSHVHFDIFGWTPTAKPGRPKGGEQQAMRALFSLLQERHPK